MLKQKEGFSRYRSIFVFFSVILFICTAVVSAAPHRGDTFSLKQPNGTQVTVKVWGDEYYQRVESIDGYSLIRNEHGWICYADLSQDGNEFIATDIVYEGIELDQLPAIRQYLQEHRGLKKGLKINPPHGWRKQRNAKDNFPNQSPFKSFTHRIRPLKSKPPRC